jgi:hypothetical protein
MAVAYAGKPLLGFFLAGFLDWIVNIHWVGRFCLFRTADITLKNLKTFQLCKRMTMENDALTKAIEQFACRIHNIPDSQLQNAWAWQSYDSEGIRFAFFRTYEELRELAVILRIERIAQARLFSAAQQILEQYNGAYWDLQAALLGAESGPIDEAPTEGEWPVRKVFAHIISAELGFYVVVRYALDGHRSGDGRPAELTREVWAATSGMDEATFGAIMAGPFEGLRDYYESLHVHVLREFSEISDTELDLPSRYWEKEPMSLRFRLHRFDSHLRQHTIQIDKTWAALDQSPNEAKRLVRLIYAALADAAGATIGAPEIGESRRLALAQTIGARTQEVAGKVD